MSGYGSDDGFAAWAAERGYTVPAGTVSAARQRGSEAVDGEYDCRFPGEPTGGATQERSWPRTGADDRYGNSIGASTVPDRVVFASYEAALLELATPGFFSKTYTEGERKVLTEVKGIRWTLVGGQGSSGGARPVSTRIEGLLAPLLTVENLPGIVAI